ncbi:hypothetical protein A2335_00445 [Candidatus Peregrinibacteria bacterium RIFOXYB2_FULL_32_7]|nr:MAG: hypothetical protein A2335_00445 [Candidatus Peregrinibacteria bacterium RIFOXYB2_FULL_32_7]
MFIPNRIIKWGQDASDVPAETKAEAIPAPNEKTTEDTIKPNQKKAINDLERKIFDGASQETLLSEYCARFQSASYVSIYGEQLHAIESADTHVISEIADLEEIILRKLNKLNVGLKPENENYTTLDPFNCRFLYAIDSEIMLVETMGNSTIPLRRKLKNLMPFIQYQGRDGKSPEGYSLNSRGIRLLYLEYLIKVAQELNQEIEIRRSERESKKGNKAINRNSIIRNEELWGPN